MDTEKHNKISNLTRIINLSGAYMKSYTLKIHWIESEETIFFDPNTSLKKGDLIETYEVWANYPEPTKYVVEVTDYSEPEDHSEYTLELTYSADKNPLIKDIDIPWGTSTITIDLQTNSAEAKWQTNPPNAKYDNKAKKVDVKSHELTEELGFVVTQRRKRRQEQFRKALQERGVTCCEITGETASAALEAAHIIEVKNNGGYEADNGILLRADLHRLFDSGALTITLEGKVVLNSQVPNNSIYRTEANKNNWKVQKETLRRISRALEQRNHNDG